MDNREEERGEGRGIIVALHAKQEDGKDFHFSANVYRKERGASPQKKPIPTTHARKRKSETFTKSEKKPISMSPSRKVKM